MSEEFGRLHPVVSLSQQGVIQEDRSRAEQRARKRHEKVRAQSKSDDRNPLDGDDAGIAESGKRIDFRI